MRIGAVVDQPSRAFRPTWLGIRPLAGWMLIVPSVVPEKYRSNGKGKMPCAGWYSAAFAAGVVGVMVPEPGRLPVVGSVGVTSGELPDELEQPAATNAAADINTAAISLFIKLLGKSVAESERSHFPRRSERCADLVVLGR